MKVNFAEEALRTEEEIRELVGVPHEHIVMKAIPIIDEHCRLFISKSPLLFLSTSNAAGKCDVSPRGDEPGSVKVLNENQLVIAERPGNRRADSITNILSNPNVGLVFLIPGLEEVLRVNGRAYMIKNKEILSAMAVKEKEPVIGIGVEVEECFIHCPRALKASNIWNPEQWGSTEEIPPLKQIFLDHLKINGVEI